MGEDSKSIGDKIVEEVDGRTESPEVRARKVWNELVSGRENKIDYWSMAWFCVTYLTGLSATLPYLKEPMIEIQRLMYNNHYLFPENLALFDKENGGKGGIQQEQTSS